jgi:hypothetical protein
MTAALVEVERPQLSPFRETSFLSIRDRAPFGFCDPYVRHTKEMTLQTGTTDISHQLHAVGCQT